MSPERSQDSLVWCLSTSMTYLIFNSISYDSSTRPSQPHHIHLPALPPSLPAASPKLSLRSTEVSSHHPQLHEPIPSHFCSHRPIPPPYLLGIPLDLEERYTAILKYEREKKITFATTTELLTNMSKFLYCALESHHLNVVTLVMS